MEAKQDHPETVLIGTRVSRQTADEFKAVADGAYRSVAAELRRMIEERIESSDHRAT